MNQSAAPQVPVALLNDYRFSHYKPGAGIMTYREERHNLDAETVILGLGYAAAILVLLGWVATTLL